MGRSKVNLAYVKDNAARKASYINRKRGLIKKMSELSTLCGVRACAVIYNEYDRVPVVWPSAQEAQDIYSRFQMLPKMEKMKKMVIQESFIRQRIKKAQEQYTSLHKENHRTYNELLKYECEAAGVNTRKQFNMKKDSLSLHEYERDTMSRFEEQMKNNNEHIQASPILDFGCAMVPSAPQPPAVEESEDDIWASMVDEYLKSDAQNFSFGA